MKIQENIILAPYTSFKIGGPAKFFCAIKNEGDLVEAVTFAKDKKLSILVIGGGSNILIGDKGYPGLVILNEIKGLKFKDEGKEGIVLAEAGAGENWSDFVAETVHRGLFGLENLSAIPGTVGASPVQNLGAYGLDVSSTIHSVRAFDTTTSQFVNLSNADCRFSYRHSRFKEEKGRFIVSGVTFKLKMNGEISLDYADLQKYFEGKAKPTLKEVHEAVIEIRRNKLPDWKAWGTAGSFFKNPVISAKEFENLKTKYPEMPGYPESDGRVKVPLGWILDKLCHAKGVFSGNVGMYEKQALVLVAKPGATASEIVKFSNDLMRQVKEKTGLEIEGEVEWVVA